ncbi:MAG: DnaD domain protein [SAR202 cluster bacterium]|nr:DnaD domain protein [SAR202 cluster bacterium]MDP6514086.1 DnaD domain protein [SAR202 cluster bacterium]MDP6714916.1 DnaD domain protein [SAR202 cluster bacterium]
MNRNQDKKYEGFPRKVRYVPVPAPLLDSLLEEIDDLAELKCTLRAIAMLHVKKGHPRFVTLGELQADRTLARSLAQCEDSAAQRIEQGMAKAVRRGTIAVASVEENGTRQQLFTLNTETNRGALEKVAQGVTSVGSLPVPEPWVEPEDTPNIFALYEQNVGMLSPMIADELREAEELYPVEWIAEAIGEAVGLNKRSWRYISRILERWEHEGRGHGKPGRYSKKAVRY